MQTEVDSLHKINDSNGIADFTQTLNYEALDQLPNIEMVIHESLRLEMTGGGLSTTCELTKTQKIGQYVIKKGTQFMINAYGLHHNPEEWHEP